MRFTTVDRWFLGTVSIISKTNWFHDRQDPDRRSAPGPLAVNPVHGLGGVMPMAGGMNRTAASGAGWTLPSWALMAVWGVVLAGIGLRFIALDLQSLWYDELLSLQIADPARSWAGILQEQGQIGDLNPPAYYFLLNAWMALFGNSETAVRLPSAILSAGAVGVAVLYFRGELAKPQVLLFLGLMAVSYGGIHYAQETRVYALLLFLSTVATLLTHHLVRSLRGGQVPRLALGTLVAVGLLAAFSHYYGILLLGSALGAVLCAALLQGRILWSVIAAGLGSLLIFVPWVAFHYSIMPEHAQAGAFWTEDLDQHYLVAAGAWFAKLLFGSYLGVALVAAGMSVGVVQAVKVLKQDPGFQAAALVVLFGLLLSVGLSLIQPTITGRNLLFLLPASYLVCGYVLSAALQRRSLTVLVPLGLAALLIGGLYDFFEPRKEQWRESAAYLTALEGCQDARIVVTARNRTQPAEIAHFAYYLPTGSGVELRPLTDFDGFDAARQWAGSDRCPVLVWAAHYSKSGFEALMLDLGIPASAVETRHFRAAHVVLEKDGS